MTDSEIVAEFAHNLIELSHLLDKYKSSWLKTKELEIKGNRDAIFIKELVYAVEQIESVTEVFSREGKISYVYLEEKLSSARRFIDCALKYFKPEGGDRL